MESKKKCICHNCVHRKYNEKTLETECHAPQNNKEYCGYDKNKNLFYTDHCPFKDFGDGGEYLYWN